MTRPSARRLALAVLLTALAGCDTPEPGNIGYARYDSRPASVAFQLNFAQGSRTLARGEAVRLRQTIENLGVRNGDDIIVRIAQSGDPALDQGRAATAAAALAGTPAHVRVIGSDTHPLGTGSSALAVVEVTRFGQVRVVCPTPIDAWERDRLLTSPPVGCANALNIAEMAVSPKDLLTPRPLRGSEGAVTANAVIRHDTDKVKDPGSFENW